MRGVLAAGLAVGLAVAVVGTAILASAASLLGVGSGAPAASSAAAAKIPPAMLALYEQAAVDDRGRHRHGGVGQRAVDAALGAQRSQLRGRGGADAVRADDFSCSRTSNSSLTCRFRSSGSGSGPRHRAAPSGEGGAPAGASGARATWSPPRSVARHTVATSPPRGRRRRGRNDDGTSRAAGVG
jgi:hypothetical protein